jgi:hypothetical protein
MKNMFLKSALVFSLCMVTVSAANAQAALLALIFGDKVASEKFHLSIDAGLNLSSMPGLQKQKSTNGFYFGLGTFIKINDKWALTPEFKPLSPRGAKAVYPLNDYSTILTDLSYDFQLNYIDVPLLVQYKVTPKLFFSLGPQFSFLTSAAQISSGNLPSGNEVSIDENIKSNFKSFYFSVPVEVGYSLSSARKGKGVDLKLRYNIGITEMISNSTYGSSKGSTFQLFLSFPFITPQDDIKAE